MWAIIAAPFVACLVLVGMHAYLGIHVIQRKVIFVDLALAQIAALGTTVAFLFGIHPSSPGAYWFSLLFTTLGAVVFSLLRFRQEKIPQEAVIGLVYALAAAVSILLVDKAPHGAEHIKEIMTGSILWVKWSTILRVGLIYLAVAVLHFWLKDRFVLISLNPDAAYQKQWNVRWWDFLFYLSFGIVITQSVAIAGVLLVFVFLVVPAIATTLLTDRLALQIVLGWGLGALVSGVGLILSYIWDLPSGPLIAAIYGSALIIIGVLKYVLGHEDRSLAVRNLTMGAAGVLLIALLVVWSGRWLGADAHSAEPVREAESQTATSPHSDSSAPAQSTEAGTGLSSTGKLQHIQQLGREAREKPRVVARELIRILSNEPRPFFRQQALKVLRQIAGSDFGYNPVLPADKNQAALEKMRRWYRHFAEQPQ